MRNVLIVGASGIFAPAAVTLLSRGVPVTGVGRSRPMPDGVEALRVDATDASALASALGARRWTDAVVYAPAVSDASLALLGAAVDARTVVVRTSADADPARGEAEIPDDTLQLGWTGDSASPRWHSPTEVSDAALAVLDDGIGRTLGCVRPWAERP